MGLVPGLGSLFAELGATTSGLSWGTLFCETSCVPLLLSRVLAWYSSFNGPTPQISIFDTPHSEGAEKQPPTLTLANAHNTNKTTTTATPLQNPKRHRNETPKLLYPKPRNPKAKLPKPQIRIPQALTPETLKP